MKRAKLTQMPLSGSGASADLTDRLLDREPRAKSAPAGPAKPATKPKRTLPPKRAKVTAAAPEPVKSPAKSSASPVRGPALGPPTSIVEPTEKQDALQQALEASDTAIAALVAAAGEAPARYDLGVRYRLNALAHHLRQVSEFVGARRRDQGK